MERLFLFIIAVGLALGVGFLGKKRNVDGTINQFHDILETVYNAYYGE